MIKRLLALPFALAMVFGLQLPATAGTTCTNLGCASGSITATNLGCTGPSGLGTYYCDFRFTGTWSGSSNLPLIIVSYNVDVDFDWPVSSSCTATLSGCGGTFTTGTRRVHNMGTCSEAYRAGTLTVIARSLNLLGGTEVARRTESTSVWLDPSNTC